MFGILHLGDITNQPCCTPGVRIVVLVPIDEGFATCDTRYCSPAATETDIVFVIEKVGAVSRIEIHRFESVKLEQRSTCPFPQTTGITLTMKLVSIASDCNWMPILEADIAAVKIDKDFVGID